MRYHKTLLDKKLKEIFEQTGLGKTSDVPQVSMLSRKRKILSFAFLINLINGVNKYEIP